jgi:hypothetical protein
LAYLLYFISSYWTPQILFICQQLTEECIRTLHCLYGCANRW